jgi:hypothetical protein
MRITDVDGFSMLTAMGDDPATRHTPVLSLTAGPGSDPADAGSLVAAAIAGGVLAEAAAYGTGWETLAPLLGTRPVPRKESP